MKFFNFLILGLFLLSISVKSQIIDFENDKYWVDAGIGNYYSTGNSTDNNTDGLSGNLSISIMKSSILYTLRYLEHTEIRIFGPDPLEKFYSLGMMIGTNFSNKYILFGISGGVGITGGIKRGKFLYTEPFIQHYDEDKFITPSLPLEISFFIKPIKYMGFGVAFFGDLNYEKTLIGMIFRLELGKLR